MSNVARFSFASAALDPLELRASLADHACGGYAAFEGWVRNHNEGESVTHLEYEAFEALGISEGEKVIAEACAKFGIDNARCVHRVGTLGLGDMAVWVGVSAPHRDEAFRACRYIIDEVKHRLPIWKKEHYRDGDSGWVNCERCAAPAHHDHAHHDHAHHDHAHHDHAHPEHTPAIGADYSRQMTLPQVGAHGQARLRASRVAVIGAGGLGVPVLQYLAGAGVGRVVIIDGDRLEASNLHRQTWYAQADCGQPKAELAATLVRRLNAEVEVEAHSARLEITQGANWLAGSDLIIDCTDNFASKFLLNDLAQTLGIPLVLASVHQFEGQLQVVDPRRRSSCLRCIWPQATRDGVVGNCAEAGVLGPVPGILGSLQALEALKILLDMPERLQDELILVDLLTLGIKRIRAPRAANCDTACSRLQWTRERLAQNASESWHLDFDALAQAANYIVIDLRSAEERRQVPLADRLARHPLLHIEFDRLLADSSGLAKDERYLLVCSRGLRSRSGCEILRERGFTQVYSLTGGVRAMHVNTES